MKKVLAVLLAGILLLLPLPALADSEPANETVDGTVNVPRLAFGMIEEYMNTYNAQISENKSAVADIVVPTVDAKKALERVIEVIKIQIDTYNTSITQLKDKLNGSLPDAEKEMINNLIANYESLVVISEFNKTSYEQQLKEFDANVARASDAQTKAAIQAEMANQQIIWGAEQLFLTHNTLKKQIKGQSDQLEFLSKQLAIMKQQEELGLITATTYKNMEKNVKDLEFALKTMKNQLASLKGQLNVMFNQDYDYNMIIEETPEFDLDLLLQMDFEQDYKIAEPNSYSVLLKLVNESAQWEAEERNFKLKFKDCYNNVFTKYENLKLAEGRLEEQKELFKQYSLKYELGLISKIAFEEQKLALDNQEMNVQIAKEELFKAYRQYEWMKKGLTL
ncbi:MAG TPA: TolC family protein [Peptococcaceae bacterium]|nr:TolC family protein [Peptococcaceae bacterium]